MCQVRLVSGNIVEVHGLQPGTTIKELKGIIKEQHGLPEDEQSFVFAGMQLQDAHTLEDYSISDESLIYMVLRILASNPRFRHPPAS